MEKIRFKNKYRAIERMFYGVLRWLLSLVAGFILSQAEVKNIFSPFALSFLSVAPFSPLSTIGVYCGAVAGFVLKSFSVYNFKYICALTMMQAIMLISGKKTYKRNVYHPVLPAVVCLICGLLFLLVEDFSVYHLLLLACEVVICGCGAYFLLYSLRALERKEQMDTRDYIALNVTLLILLCAFDGFYVYGVSLSLVLTVYFVYFCAYYLDPVKAAVFTLPLCFVAALIHFSDTQMLPLLFVPALIANTTAKFKKQSIEISFCVAYMLLLSVIRGLLWFSLPIMAVPVIAAVLFRITPKSKIAVWLSKYVHISHSDGMPVAAGDELCAQYSASADHLAKEINATVLIPIVNEEIESRLKRYLFLNRCRNIRLVTYCTTEGKQTVSLFYEGEKVPNAAQIRGKISELAANNFVVCAEQHEGQVHSIKLEQADNYAVECCALYKAKRGESVCGDCVTAFKSAAAKYYIAIADGMGSGKDAFIKSNHTITLLKKLLKSDISPEKAINSVNASMEMIKEEIGFSTIDLCKISLDSGVLEVYKCGAYDSLILRGNRLISIQAGGFPAGLGEKISHSYFSTAAEDGDMIIMMSDGAANAIEQIQAEALLNADAAPETLVHRLMDRAYRAGMGEADDDMTVLVAKVSKRQFE